MRDLFEKSIVLVDSLRTISPEGYTTIDVRSTGEARISHFPAQEKIKDATLFMIRTFGKFAKSDQGTIEATKDNITMCLFGVLKCEQVGTKKAIRKKVIQTDEVEEYDQPVYRCYSPLIEN